MFITDNHAEMEILIPILIQHF
jgi:hypothetical protein